MADNITKEKLIQGFLIQQGLFEKTCYIQPALSLFDFLIMFWTMFILERFCANSAPTELLQE